MNRYSFRDLLNWLYFIIYGECLWCFRDLGGSASANENQPADVVETESRHHHCEWNIQNLFSEYMLIL